jgi:NAD(P) transhydrogenase subunit alpha
VNAALMAEIWVFALAVFVGFEVISKVPVSLHTPLMSGTNAIHGIVMLGGVLVLGERARPALTVLGFLARRAGADEPVRRLRRHRPHAGDVQGQEAEAGGGGKR